MEVLDSGSVCLLLDGKGPFGTSGNLFEDSVRLFTLLTTLNFPSEKKTRVGMASYHSRLDESTTQAFSKYLALSFLTITSSSGKRTLSDNVTSFLRGEGGLRPQCAKEVDGMARAVVSTNKGKFLTRSASYGRSTPALQHETRFLAGGIRCAGRGLLNFRKKVEDVLDVMLRDGDKGVRKNSCKLLRHVLSRLVECCPNDCWVANERSVARSVRR